MINVKNPALYYYMRTLLKYNRRLGDRVETLEKLKKFEDDIFYYLTPEKRSELLEKYG